MIYGGRTNDQFIYSREISALKGDSKNDSIRDYLAEMQAWIQLYAASHAINGTMMAKDIGSAMDNYAKTLTNNDITAINTGKIGYQRKVGQIKLIDESLPAYNSQKSVISEPLYFTGCPALSR